MTSIKAFTDGSYSSRRPDVGGVGVHFPNGECKDISQAFFDKPTHQRAELKAVQCAIETVRTKDKEVSIEIYTDSKYAIGCCTNWLSRWKQNGWQTASGQSVLHQDILKSLCENLYNVSFFHVRAHTNQKDFVSKANAAADELAKKAVNGTIQGKK